MADETHKHAASGPTRLGRWWLDRSVLTKGLIVIAVPLIALLSIGVASLVVQHSETQARAVRVRAYTLNNATTVVLVDMLNAETGVRGYALTDDRAFLAPYTMMRTRIGTELAAMRHTADVAGATAGGQSVDATTADVLTALDHLVSAIDRGESSSTVNALLRTGKTAMDRLRGQAAHLVAAPTAVLTTRNQINSLESVLSTLNIAGLVVGSLAGLVGVALFTSGISRRVTATAANADRLGRGEPLHPVTDARDELGRLTHSLTRAQQLLVTRTAEIEAARDQAVRANAAKSTFLSNTSHELRTPLNSILGFTQLLELSDLGEEDRQSVTRILVAGRHLLNLINELIDTARVESGELTLSVEPVTVGPLIQETVQLFLPLATDRSVAIRHERTDQPLTVYADQQRLRQVLVNLMSNAVKYNRYGGTITVTCQAEGANRVGITVADTGPGLTSDDLQRLFVPFDRLGHEESGVEGTGIGLPLAKALTEAMGGQLSVTSILGEGSVFTIALRRAPNVIHEPTHDQGAQRPQVRPAGAGPHLDVLYIEDNPTNIELVSRYLKTRGNVILHTARTGREGIEAAIREAPEIILLDLHLPDLHGDEVLQQLRAVRVTSGVPVVVLSADASPGVVRRLRARGAFAYLTKPIELDKLGELLDSITATRPGSNADSRDVPAQAVSHDQPGERSTP